MAKVIGIVGSRRRNKEEDFYLVRDAFLKVYKTGDTLVSGGCPQGGDNFCERLARLYKVPILIHRAEWNKLGRGAGFARNTFIAHDADILIACVSKDRTGGTEDTITKFLARPNKSDLRAYQEDLILV